MVNLSKKIKESLRSIPGKEVSVEDIMSSLGLQDEERRHVITFLKQIPEEQGVFITGRRGHPSRFSKNMVECLESPATSIQEAEDGLDSRHGQLFEHQFLLRSGMVAKISLPVDLTAIEAERLSRFIKSLPIEDKVGDNSYE